MDLVEERSKTRHVKRSKKGGKILAIPVREKRMHAGVGTSEKEKKRKRRKEERRRATADCEETEGLSERGVQCECNTFP